MRRRIHLRHMTEEIGRVSTEENPETMICDALQVFCFQTRCYFLSGANMMRTLTTPYSLGCSSEIPEIGGWQNCSSPLWLRVEAQGVVGSCLGPFFACFP